MNFWRRYVAYIQDNPQHYWFRRHIYGWGWVPATREGWLTLAGFIAAFVFILMPYIKGPQPTDASALIFAAQVLAWAGLLLVVCIAKGEPPKWQWGFPEEGET